MANPVKSRKVLRTDLSDQRDPWLQWRDSVTFGGWCTIPNSFSAEIMGSASFDWCCVDMQHGLVGHDGLVPMLQALTAVQMSTFVRVPWNDPAQVMRVLDAGAHGVIVPMVNTAEEAAQAVSACRYAPEGIRSWGPVRASLRNGAATPRELNRSIACVIMVETVIAINNLESILEVPGIDGVFVGPNDLALSAGQLPVVGRDWISDNPLAALAKTCQARRIVPGIYCLSVQDAPKLIDIGFRMLALQSDARLLHAAARQVVADARRIANVPHRAGIRDIAPMAAGE